MNAITTILTNLTTNEKIPTNTMGSKLEQKFSRALKSDLVNAIQEQFNTISNESVKVLRTADGITLVADTSAGFVSIVLNPTIKNLDYEPFEEADLYEQEQAEAKAKAEEKAKAKAEKIKRDTERRAKEKAERAERLAKASQSD